MEIRHATHPDDAARLGTDQLRARFLVDGLFAAGEVRLALAHDDRMIIGGAVPKEGPLVLEPSPQMRARTFCERRELAVVNLGEGVGAVIVDGQPYSVGHHDVLYVGVSANEISLAADPTGRSVRFYLVSVPANVRHPVRLTRAAEAETLHLGDPARANERVLRRYIHTGGVLSERLVLGITTLNSGSVWNTMPPHLHDRRTEIYLYTGLDTDDRVLHLCGSPDELRTLVVSDGEAVISPPWSVHAGAGTGPYSFVWAMSGENQSFDDMDGVALADLR